jgi:HAD superfamily hydrolase (TIGR01509 family)
MAMDERGLGKVLQRARQAAGLTQQQLCNKANLSFSTLTKIERGAIKSPSIFTIQSIAGALNLSLDELIGNSGPSRPARELKKTRSGASFIYFDLNDCLVTTYQKHFDKLALDSGNRLEVVESAYWHYNDSVCRGDMTIDEFNSYLADRLGVQNVSWKDYYMRAVQPIKQMQEVLLWAADTYRIGILTNTMPGLVDAMKTAGILPNIHYDAIVDSSEVKAIKPEAKMYQIAETKAGCPAGEILLIDDDRINLMAAEHSGWQVLSFKDSHPEESVERVKQALEPMAA